MGDSPERRTMNLAQTLFVKGAEVRFEVDGEVFEGRVITTSDAQTVVHIYGGGSMVFDTATRQCAADPAVRLEFAAENEFSFVEPDLQLMTTFSMVALRGTNVDGATVYAEGRVRKFTPDGIVVALPGELITIDRKTWTQITDSKYKWQLYGVTVIRVSGL